MMTKPIRDPGLRLAPHTHAWYVEWMVREGWVMGPLSVPSRSMILKGDRSAGHRMMVRYYEGTDGQNLMACVAVPGARRPNERLGREEYRTMRRSIECAYNRMGLSVPSEHNRRCMK